VWDVATAKEVRRWPEHPRTVYAVAISPEGKWLATGGWDSAIKLWDLATGLQRTVFQGHTGLILALNFSADGKSIASCSKDRTVRVWDVQGVR
jgi:WD40 repeat protein